MSQSHKIVRDFLRDQGLEDHASGYASRILKRMKDAGVQVIEPPPAGSAIPFGQKLHGKATTIDCVVTVSLVVGLSYDDQIPDEQTLRRDLLDNFACHPTVNSHLGRRAACNDGVETLKYEVMQITS